MSSNENRIFSIVAYNCDLLFGVCIKENNNINYSVYQLEKRWFSKLNDLLNNIMTNQGFYTQNPREYNNKGISVLFEFELDEIPNLRTKYPEYFL